MKTSILSLDDANYEVLCDEYRGTEIKSLNDILDKLAEFESKYPNHVALTTLDDLGQADYTSMHATIAHDLDDIEGHDLSTVDSTAFEDGEHIGYLSSKSEFFIRKSNFIAKVKSVTFSNVCSEGLTLDNKELSVIEKIHANPIDYIDREVAIKIVPVEYSALAICAFPNGYFACDLSPFDNYALAKHLEKNYGYKLFGIGASLVGFQRKEPLNATQALQLSKDIAKLYNRDNDIAVVNSFSKLTQEFSYLFLKYVEYLEY